jgi:hypothetical protein
MVGCRLRAFGIVAAPANTVGELRHNPGPPLRQRLSPVLLKYSDEQTVVGLAAVLSAVHRFGMQKVDFTDWGVIAAPRWLGRLKLVTALHKFERKGAPSASPMLVPHLSLHAVSGTITQVLGSHGVNFGVSSGPDNVAEGLQAAVSVLSAGRLPGLWLVLTGWDPEPAPDDHGGCATCAGCRGVALALEPSEDFSGPCLRVHTTSPAHAPGEATSLTGLAEFLTSGEGGTWGCPLEWGGWAELTGAETGA